MSQSPESKITFMPINVSVPMKVGDSVLDVALECDIPLQHACGGFCACATCHIHVLSGAEFLSSREDDENDRVQTADRLTESSRLGCQTRLLKPGNVVVEIMNVDE